jgi:hypothetical protein
VGNGPRQGRRAPRRAAESASSKRCSSPARSTSRLRRTREAAAA